MDELEPLSPDEAVELYLKDKESEYAEATIRSHRSRLRQFLRWATKEELENLNGLTGRDLYRYRVWRRADGNLSPPSEKSQMDALRQFIRFCEHIDAVADGLSETVVSPQLRKGEHARNEMVTTEEAEKILDRLRTYEFASSRHVCFRLLWRTACRRSTLVALDLGDYDQDNQHLEIQHRPDTGTPLKLQSRGERFVSLTNESCNVLDAWIRDRRPDVTDRHERKPLITTSQGRIHPGTVQNYVYSVTIPCFWNDKCPHERIINECDAANARSEAYACPSSKSPHTVRRGALTHWLSEDIPTTAVSDRASVTPDILELHYDGRTKRRKMEQRREYLEGI